MAEEQSKGVMDLTFNNIESLRRYVTETGKILPRRFTRLNAREQRHVSRMIKRARNLLLMK